jgi:hypothetical protein
MFSNNIWIAAADTLQPVHYHRHCFWMENIVYAMATLLLYRSVGDIVSPGALSKY